MNKHQKLKEVMKITIADISYESGESTTMVHDYLNSGKIAKAERVANIETGIINVAQKRIENASKILEELL